MQRYVISHILGLVGAAIGGVAGYYTYHWIYNQGFIGGMIPGAFLGLGCSLLARHPSLARGVVCGIAGLALGFFADWTTTDTTNSFWGYLQNAKTINQVILLTIVVGAIIAFWLGKDAGLAGRSARGPHAGEPARPPEAPRAV
jgi:hypothetical protein